MAAGEFPLEGGPQVTVEVSPRFKEQLGVLVAIFDYEDLRGRGIGLGICGIRNLLPFLPIIAIRCGS